MTCDTCKRPCVITLAHEVVVWKKRFSWHECKECWLKAEGKKR